MIVSHEIESGYMKILEDFGDLDCDDSFEGETTSWRTLKPVEAPRAILVDIHNYQENHNAPGEKAKD